MWQEVCPATFPNACHPKLLPEEKNWLHSSVLKSQGKTLIGSVWTRYPPLNQSTMTRQMWSYEMWNFPQNHMDKVEVWAVSRKGVCGSQKTVVWGRPQNSSPVQFHHQEVERSGFTPRSFGLQSPYWFSDAGCLSKAQNVYSFIRKSELASQPPQKVQANVLSRQ